MGLAFLTPLFLGGLALLAAPWIIHQIRRPEREPLRFSSLMFIPRTRKEVIERRRVQHILLMLLRMAMLALLALAFSRPYWRSSAFVDAEPQGATWHVVLLDASYSMGAEGRFEKARAEALSIVDGLAPDDRAAVILFSNAPRVVAPLFPEGDLPADSRSLARSAIESARLTEETTAYATALQTAQSVFLAARSKSAGFSPHLVAHLVSDFQRIGLPEKSSRWKLDPSIELRCVDVGDSDGANCAIEDVSVREAGSDELRVRGRVRNWSSAGKISRTVKIVAQGREYSQSAISIEPGAARQVSFQIPIDPALDLEGRLEIEGDSLEIDNRRYFARRGETRLRVVLLAPEDSRGDRSVARFLSSALPTEGDLPWRLELHAPNGATEELLNGEGSPAICIVTAAGGWATDIFDSIRHYVERGGRVLLTVDGSAPPDALNEGLLVPWGTRSEGPLYSEKRESRFALLSSIDFDHPIFYSLREPRFNDFSSVRFHNHHILSLPDRPAVAEADEGLRVIARFESDDDGREAPAMIEARVGEGRVVIWAFGADLEWSNLPRSVKFIPLLYETLSYLGGGGEERRTLLVGDPLRPPKSLGVAKQAPSVTPPGETEEIDLTDSNVSAGDIRIRRSGLVRWGGTPDDPDGFVEAANVQARESNPERIGLEEFQMQLCAPRLDTGFSTPLDFEKGSIIDGFVIQHEFWRLFMGLLLAFFLFESWRAAAALR